MKNPYSIKSVFWQIFILISFIEFKPVAQGSDCNSSNPDQFNVISRAADAVHLISDRISIGDTEPIKNFAVLQENAIYRGGTPTESQIKYLGEYRGVKTIINLQGGDPLLAKLLYDHGEFQKDIDREKTDAIKHSIRMYHLPLNSMGTVTDEEAKRIDQALELMSNPANQPVYIHCSQGQDRTGLLSALYRVKFQNWSPASAYKEFRAMGHSGFKARVDCQLDKYFFKVTSWRSPDAVPCVDGKTLNKDFGQ